jgi:hypothetical protein
MRLHPFSLLLTAALLSSAPAWSGTPKSVDKTVTGKLVSVEDNGMGETYTIETRDGSKVNVNADPGSERPENAKLGTQVVVSYAEVTQERVDAVRLATGPKFKKKPKATVQGTLLGYSSGDMGDYVTIKKGGKEKNYLADFGVLSPEQVSAYLGKKVELSVYKHTSTEFRDLEVRP